MVYQIPDPLSHHNLDLRGFVCIRRLEKTSSFDLVIDQALSCMSASLKTHSSLRSQFRTSPLQILNEEVYQQKVSVTRTKTISHNRDHITMNFNQTKGEEGNLPRNFPQTEQLPNPHALTLEFGPAALKTSTFLPLFLDFILCSTRRHVERGAGFEILMGRFCWN